MDIERHHDSSEQGMTPEENRPREGEGREQEAEAAGAEGRSASQEHTKPTRGGATRGLLNILNGGIVNSRIIKKQKYLILLIVLYSMVLIAERYWVESLTREKLAQTEQVKYMEERKIQIQRQYQETIKLSRIAETLDTIGVGIYPGAPIEI